MFRKKGFIFVSLLVFLFASVYANAQGIDTGITGYEPPATSSPDNGVSNSGINLDDLVENNPESTGVTSPESNPSTNQPTITGDELTGDTKLACEAILCLSSPTRPGECAPSINRYFSIDADKWKDTVKKRKNFLNKCPASNEEVNMVSLVNTLAEGSGLCTIDQLNNRGSWQEIVVKTTHNYNQCRKLSPSSTTAPSGKKVSVDYQWISNENTTSRNQKSYCEQTTRYFEVNGVAPGECTALWNHIYTDYSERPRVVKGSEVWQTHWTD